jgi:hypothetical protein
MMGSGGRGGTALLRFSVFPHFARQPPKDPNALYLAVNKPSERRGGGEKREGRPGCLSSSSPKKHVTSEQTEENKQKWAPKMRKRWKAKGPGEQGEEPGKPASLWRLPESGGEGARPGRRV